MRQDQLVDYVRRALGVRSEAKIAKALGLTPAGFSQKKVRGTLDIVELRQLLVENSIDVSKFDELVLPKPKKIVEAIATPTISKAYRKVPEYNVRVSAGHGQFLGIEEIKQELQIPRQWLPANGKVGIVCVEGDSMTPTISNGDSVVVEFDSGYTSDGLYLIRVEDSAYVKRIQREFGSLRIISDNPLYRELTVESNDGNDFGLIGRVALIIRKT